MKIRRFTVFVASGSSLMTADGIEFDGKLWIVPRWDLANTGELRPQRMIRFDHLKHQKPGPFGHDYSLNLPLPPGVLDGTPPPGFEIRSADQAPWLDPTPAH